MNQPQTIGFSLGGAATTFWFPLAGHDAATTREHTLFPAEGLATGNILVLSPELAWSFPAFPERSIEIPGLSGTGVATVLGPLTFEAMTPRIHLARPSVSAAAREFAARARLEGLLEDAVALLHRNFRVLEVPKVEFEIDPEDGDQYLVLDARVDGSVRENVAAHKRYARDWARTADWPRVKMIRLAFDLG